MKMKDIHIGDLVYTKNVGYPFDRTDYGSDSWEGASCVVVKTNTGGNNQYVEVMAVLPLKTTSGEMKTCVFHPESIYKEDRTWLKSNLVKILKLRTKLIDAAAEFNGLITKI